MEESFKTLVLKKLKEAFYADQFIKLTLGNKAKSNLDLNNIYIRIIETKEGNKLNFIMRYINRDISKTLKFEEALAAIKQHLDNNFLDIHVFTNQESFDVITNRLGKSKLHIKQVITPLVISKSHNIEKKYILKDEYVDEIFKSLGLLNNQNEVKKGKDSKYRQVQQIIKLIDGNISQSKLLDSSNIKAYDFGCGKGYVTFGIYQYLSQIKGIQTSMIGIDQKQSLIDFNNTVAKEFNLDNLQFAQGNIIDASITSADLIVALHACDTATDDAIFQGIKTNAQMMILVPCCQHEIRNQFQIPKILRGMFKHDIYKEKESQAITDSMRGLLLQMNGYKVKIFEFISDAHTHRNTMIMATKTSDTRNVNKAVLQLEAIKQFYGIDGIKLERLLALDKKS